MKLFFVKMQSLGNDFLILCPNLNFFEISSLDETHFKFLADRRFGIGADQILIVKESAADLKTDFDYIIINSDGKEVEQCGNGARCVKKFLEQKKLWMKKDLKLLTKSGVIEVSTLDKNQIKVNMSSPVLTSESINFNPRNLVVEKKTFFNNYFVTWKNKKEFKFSPVSMGNPHIVFWVDDLSDESLEDFSIWFMNSDYFANGVNMEFCHLLDHATIKMRVFERGVGETLACGTGACASVVCGINNNYLKKNVDIDVIATGGTMKVSWDGTLNNPVFLSGPAKIVFEGVVEL